LGGLERPDVDKIEGLSPVISIEQKTVSRSPRSTVGTITEIYDFLRLLYARAGTAFSYETNEEMVKYSDEQIVDLIIEAYEGKKVVFLAPKVKGRKGHYRELFEQIQRQGFTKVRVDGVLQEITKGMKLDRYKIHDIEMVVDRLLIDSKDRKRIYESVVTTMKHGSKAMMIMEFDSEKVRHFSRSLMCPSSGISYPDPEPNLFSFNSPYGACPSCSGLGEVTEADLDKIIPNTSLSVKKGALAPLGEYKKSWIFDKIDSFLQFHDYSINTPLSDITEDVLRVLLYGNEDMEQRGKVPVFKYEGLINFITRHSEESSAGVQRWAQSFMNKKLCPECLGTRLRKEAHFIRIGNKHIGNLASLDLSELAVWFNTIENHFSNAQLQIATEILKEIRSRLSFMLDVGLNYLTLHRSARSLSGGEAQRIRLATQIGSELLNVIYVLDEPSIGLHQRDNTRLIRSLQKLRDTGNSVIVVEHDKEMIESADWVVEIGPKAGKHGGKIIQVAKPHLLNADDSTTAAYLRGTKSIEIPKKRRKGNGDFMELKGANGHNLKNVDIKIPLGTLTCITGVSGSGKSSLITNTLLPILMHYVNDSVKKPLEYKSVHGLEHIDKVIQIDQSPIGRTPRSNPATYTKVFDEIRSLFASLPEAQIRGYKPGRFSFNVAGGKCETCNGGGLKQIEMNFLPDVYVECDTCQGKRYNRETLEVRFKGKSISDVLNMTVEEAVPFFESIPKIARVVQTLYSVGLGYITLGQPSTTLSGGEAQRIKLASELAKKSTGKTIYLLDEPSTGLHFEDIRMLLDVLQRLVDEGNTVLVIEHNLDVVKVADYVIDLGPEGGKFGGEIIAKGTPEELVKKFKNTSHTAKYLEQEL
jgi:excinuclease ABC subunit A